MEETGETPLNADALTAVVRRAWKRTLGEGQFEGGDDFFACGGDSVAALAVTSEVADATGLDVQAGWLYEHPRLADAVTALVATADGGLAPIAAQNRVGRHALSFQQEGLLNVMDHVRGDHHYQVAYAVELPRSVDGGRLREALEGLAARHPVLVTRVTRLGGAARQEVGGEGAPALERVEVSRPDELADAVDRWAAPTIALDGPLVRTGLIGTSMHRRLVLAAHQMVMDPWSWGLLLRDLAALYAEPDADGAPVLAYSDYARWQREQLSGPVYDRHLDFWRRRVDGYPAAGVPLPSAPCDVPPAGPAARLPVEVPGPVVDALRAAGQALGSSLFEVLLALFHLAVGRWAGSADVLVASATASRTRPGTEEVAGFFVNGRFTRSALGEIRTVQDLIGQVKDGWRDADAHRELHLEKTLFDLGLPDVANVKFSLNAIPTLASLPSLGGEPLHPVPVATVSSARRHVSVGLSPAGGGLAGALTYRTDLLRQGHARALVEEFSALWRLAAAEPTGRVRLA